MTKFRILPAGYLLFFAAACQTYGAGDEVPARIDGPTNASRAELQRSINDALGTVVLLADDALTNSSTLTIERNQPDTMQNPRPQGRVMEMPIKFRLVKRGDNCYLVDQRNEDRYLLESSNCIPE